MGLFTVQLAKFLHVVGVLLVWSCFAMLFPDLPVLCYSEDHVAMFVCVCVHFADKLCSG